MWIYVFRYIFRGNNGEYKLHSITITIDADFFYSFLNATIYTWWLSMRWCLCTSVEWIDITIDINSIDNQMDWMVWTADNLIEQRRW